MYLEAEMQDHKEDHEKELHAMNDLIIKNLKWIQDDLHQMEFPGLKTFIVTTQTMRSEWTWYLWTRQARKEQSKEGEFQWDRGWIKRKHLVKGSLGRQHNFKCR